jgi:hypothetical protein
MDMLVHCKCGKVIALPNDGETNTLACVCGQAVPVPARDVSADISPGAPPARPATPNRESIIAGPPPPTFAHAQDRGVPIAALVAELLQRGFSSHEVENKLVVQGLDRDEARQAVREVVVANRHAVRMAGLRNMGVGGGLVIVGLAVTIISYVISSTLFGGGSFLLAGGAILFGALQFFYGLLQAIFGST